jgi:hypothetical protein
VWLNEYSSQFLPILGLLGLRLVVGAGEWLLRRLGRERKSAEEQLAEELGRHRAKEFNVPQQGDKCVAAGERGGAAWVIVLLPLRRVAARPQLICHCLISQS